jgi:hypothetical protein
MNAALRNHRKMLNFHVTTFDEVIASEAASPLAAATAAGPLLSAALLCSASCGEALQTLGNEKKMCASARQEGEKGGWRGNCELGGLEWRGSEVSRVLARTTHVVEAA